MYTACIMQRKVKSRLGVTADLFIPHFKVPLNLLQLVLHCIRITFYGNLIFNRTCVDSSTLLWWWRQGGAEPARVSGYFIAPGPRRVLKHLRLFIYNNFAGPGLPTPPVPSRWSWIKLPRINMQMQSLLSFIRIKNKGLWSKQDYEVDIAKMHV